MLMPHWGKRSFDISTAQSDLIGLFWMKMLRANQNCQFRIWNSWIHSMLLM